MSGWWRLVPGVLLLSFLAVAPVQAGRVPMVRTDGQRSDGMRSDESVPYLTTGKSAFGAYSVAPRVVASPNVQDPAHAMSKPVYNIIFYGSVQSFGDKFNGAQQRARPLTPR